MKPAKATKKVLLIQPNYKYQRKSWPWGIHPPLGIAYIAAVLEQEGILVEILDANALDLTPKEVASFVLKNNFSIIGLSILTPVYEFAVDVVANLPKGILKIAGGSHAMATHGELLRQGFDAVVMGEGEYPMLEIAQGKDFANIAGISFNGKINQPEPIKNPDIFPFPARHLLPSNGIDLPYCSGGTRHFPWAPIFTSRGCPYDCYYCFKKIFGYRFRPRSAENVVNEVIYLKHNYNIKEIHIQDDCFNYDLERAERILERIIELDLNIGIRCSNGLRVDKINKEFLNKFKRAGGYYIAYGLETGDQKVLDRISKRTTLEQAKTAVKLAKETGIAVSGFFMFGLLGDTKETMEKTLEFAKELDLDIASFVINAPYPGTKIWESVKREGNLFFDGWNNFHHTSGRMMFAHPEVASPSEVEQMFQRAFAEFYFRPRFILRQMSKVRSLNQLKFMFQGLNGIIKSGRQVKR